MKEIGRGAEAVIYLNGNKVIKERLSKEYRISQLDNTLRKQRTKREAKVLEKLKPIAPLLINTDDCSMKIEMEYLQGPKLRDVLEDNHEHYATEIGKLIAFVHSQGIVHHDLTTSNMIATPNGLKLIDFGLSFFSEKEEDRAVDLHLLERGLDSKHFAIKEQVWNAFLKAYTENFSDAKKVINRLDKVEKRGRNKQKN